MTAALVASPVSAHADYDPLGSGTTSLTLDKRFARLLDRNGVKLLADQGASRRGRSFALPVTGGQLDPTTDKGVVEHEGTLIFQRGRRRVPLRDLELKTKREPLVAKVGGSQLKLAAAAKLSVERQGFGTALSARRLQLTAKFATRLAKKLRLHDVFVEGQTLGTIRSTPQPTTLAVLPQGRATLALDPALVAKLDSLFVSINPIFPAERSPGPHFSFPLILGGTISPTGLLGTVRSGGSIEFFQQGSGQVFLDEFWFDLGTGAALANLQIEPTPTFPGKLGQLPALHLGAAAISADPGARTVTLSSVRLTLEPAIADAFNQAFAQGKVTFSAGEPFGTLTFTAQTQ